MQPRFTIIQGGLSEVAQTGGPVSGRTGFARVTESTAARARAPAGWRVQLRRPAELREAEIEEWRALAARTTNLDPFADPDFLATAALHATRGRAGGIAFALAFSSGDAGIERLCGVIPLALPHPMWAGPTIAQWQAPLSPRPVEPVFADGAAVDAIAALLDHLGETGLHLSGIAATGALLADLSADARLRVADRHTPASIPEAQFVSVGARKTVSRVERITAPGEIRDAVESFLMADASRSRRPLLSDPSTAATIRVVSRLFARRGLIEVELHAGFGEVVSAAIRLGREGERVLWRSVDLDEALPVQSRTVDLAVSPAGAIARPAAVRLVVS